MNQFYAPPLGPVNKTILIVAGSLFIFSSILEKASGLGLAPWMGLSPAGLARGQIHTLLSYPLIPTGLMEIIFDGLILWFLGGSFESSWGPKRYLSFLLISSLGGGLFFVLVASLLGQGFIPLTGLAGLCLALCLAYGIIYPDRIFSLAFLFPVKAKFVCMILAGLELYRGLFSPGGILSWGHLGATLSGALALFYFSRKRIRRPSFLGRLRPGKRPSLRSIKGGKNPRYFQ